MRSRGQNNPCSKLKSLYTIILRIDFGNQCRLPHTKYTHNAIKSNNISAFSCIHTNCPPSRSLKAKPIFALCDNPTNHLQVVPWHYHGDGSKLLCFGSPGSTMVENQV